MPLTIRNISKSYKENGMNQTVLSDISFEMETGETLLITGPTGSGKSTLINILGCLESPTSGTYILGDANPLDYNRKKTARFRRDYLGFLFSQPTLLPQLTVLENVLVPCLSTGLPLKADVVFAKRLLEILQMSDLMNYYPEGLNKEQQFRTAAARAFIKRPSLVLADEPVCMLDSRIADAFITDVIEAQKQCGSMFLMTANTNTFSDRFDRTGTLHQTLLAISGRRDSAPGKGDEVFTYKRETLRVTSNSIRSESSEQSNTKRSSQVVESTEIANSGDSTISQLATQQDTAPSSDQLIDEFRRRFQ